MRTDRRRRRPRLSAGDAQADKNDYYFRDWDPDTTSTASDYPEINVKEGTTVSATKNAWIPAASESPITYDANGNLTGDALWSYTYDEENRLITMEETSAAATAGFPDTTITFKYDHLGRRVEKKVVRGTTTESHLRFVWRGWLLVAELNAASDNALVKTYTWGPDVSGSLGGAGGNGGVLIMKDHTSTVNESFYPAYDARGNVTGLIDTAGNLDAAYEYDPFGKLIRYAGPRSTSMSLLYGTKYTDMESGLIYYGHRYYDPRQGRFINRDPIEEEGGINLYGFVGNNTVNRVDYLGLEWVEVCEDGYTYDITSMWDEEGEWVSEVWTNFQPTTRCKEVWVPVPELNFNDPGNDTGSGGGGESGGNGNNSPGEGDDGEREEDRDKEKTDCEKLVDDMVQLAQLHDDGGLFESVDLGSDVIDRYTSPGSLGRSLFGNWYGQEPAAYRLSGTTGFRSILTLGGQDTELLLHVAAGASAELHRLGNVAAILGSAYDTLQWVDSRIDINIPFVTEGKDLAGLETIAEIAGNFTGVNVGSHLRGFLEGSSSEAQLRASLSKELCE